MSKILDATKTDKTLPAKGDFPEKVIWKLTVQTPEGPKEAEMFRLPTDPEPTGEVQVKPTEYGLRASFPRQGGPGKGGGNYNDPKRLRGENYRSALHAAISLAAYHKGPTPLTSDQIVVVADKFYDAIEQKAKVGD